jgi:nicotinamide mononucleotide (NMN) deamidase PncC
MKNLKLAVVASLSLMTFNGHACERHLAEQLVNMAKEKKLVITTAESCTGGMISAAITAVPGSSSVFSYGFVTYGK